MTQSLSLPLFSLATAGLGLCASRNLEEHKHILFQTWHFQSSVICHHLARPGAAPSLSVAQQGPPGRAPLTLYLLPLRVTVQHGIFGLASQTGPESLQRLGKGRHTSCPSRAAPGPDRGIDAKTGSLPSSDKRHRGLERLPCAASPGGKPHPAPLR